jgi:hypothetical protein
VIRVCIVGTQRSGSNLVRLMFDALPDVVAPPSAHELQDLAPLVPRFRLDDGRAGVIDLIDQIRALIDLNALPWPAFDNSTETILGHLPEPPSLIRAVFAFYDALAESTYSTAWVSKNLENVHWISRIQAEYRDVHFLHLVRDPRDVALSFAKAPIGPKDPVAIALKWMIDQRAAIDARVDVPPAQWHTLRYEDLVADPAASFSACCRELGVAWDPASLDFNRRSAASDAAGLSALWKNLDRPVNRDSVGKYRDPEQRAFVVEVEEALGPLIDAFDYERLTQTTKQYTPAEIDAVRARDAELRRQAEAARDRSGDHIYARRERFLAGLRDDLIGTGGS